MSTFRKPRWRDPRLGIGILLVAVSVALGGWVFAQADQTSPVFIAGSTIAVGDTLADIDLQIVEVHLGNTQNRYLDPVTLAEQFPDPAQQVFHQSIPAGEFISLNAIGDLGELPYRPVSVVVTNPTPLAIGNVVDLWVVAQDFGSRDPQAPRLVASGLHVRGIDDEESLFAAGTSLTVHVLVHESEVGNVLGAIATPGTVTLVPQLGG